MKTAIFSITAGAASLAACAPVGGPGVSTYYDCGGGTRLKIDYLDGDRVMVQMNDNEIGKLNFTQSNSCIHH